nr:MAG TPA: hypothetical protein [Caudoviricetes sp.]
MPQPFLAENLSPNALIFKALQMRGGGNNSCFFMRFDVL